MPHNENWLNLFVRRMTDQYRERFRVDPTMLPEQFTQELMENGVLPYYDESIDKSRSWLLTNENDEALHEEVELGEQCRDQQELRAHPEMTGGGFEAVRNLRLKSEMAALEENFRIFSLSSSETPAGICKGHILSLRCKGFNKGQDALNPIESNHHEANLYFPYGYPDDPPIFRMRTPCFHPNISEGDGRVCIKEGTTAYRSGYSLVELVKTLEEMIAYRKFDPTDPFNTNAVVFALVCPEKIKAIGGKPFSDRPVEPDRVYAYLKWLDESKQKGNIWALKKWLDSGKPPQVGKEKRIEFLGRA